ncbi:mitochondrial carrier protein, putative [Pediculus humanus corporis]|uniref:Mitochondrial carrier protein, putative n=1 Tax=Pediculus humanus subsp. corporis TaxID=121224 RepID=E0VD13_PEDHC|nr:mitochondrial carrier protein, putative [Pediculus humanus corporis]EEB11269.1 mitochondrial carrier protein, putative [Pediculus humanus corporis]
MDLQDDTRFRITPVQQMAAACSGALITSLIVTPLDVVKIRLQAQQKSVESKCFLYCNGLMDHLCPCFSDNGTGNPPNPQCHLSPNWYQRPGKFSGTLDAFVKITKTEGLVSLWSGLSPTLVLAIPSTVVYFVTYEQLRVKMNDLMGTSACINSANSSDKAQPFWIPLLAGATARIWSASLVSPLELVRTKMQSKRLSYLEIGQALKSLLQYHGVTGLWKGLGSTLLRDVPFSAIYWVHYEWFKSKFIPLNEVQAPNVAFSFLGGALSGCVAAFITTPFDVAKTHQQIELGEMEIYRGKCKNPPGKIKSTTYSILKKIYSQNGFSGIFAGLTPRLVKVAPACAIMVSTFEYGKSFFERRNKKIFDCKQSNSNKK